MIITKTEKMIIPQTPEGMLLAESYEKQLKEIHCFAGRREDTQSIIIEARYYFDMSLEALREDGSDNH